MVAGTRKALPSLAGFLNPHTLATVFGMVGEDSGDDRNGDEYEDNMTSGPSSPSPRTTKRARLE
jgi:hypothetical protein